MPVDTAATLGDIVTDNPHRSRVLEKFGLDYCCHGEQTLASAVGAAGLDIDAVTAALDVPAPADAAGTHGSSGAGNNAALAHEIVDVHHAYMWEEMPRLAALVDKVYHVHGQRHPELAAVREAYLAAVRALEPHMTTEERSVFPTISRLEKGGRPVGLDSLADTIDTLVEEHLAVGELFRTISTLTGGYVTPADGCNSYRMMLDALREMELDLHEHIHKENNILFPAARALQGR